MSEVMKRLFRSLILPSLFLAPTVLVAQDETDALRYSFQPYHGTSRGMGLGNAMGSLGADFSTLSVNPAGIGLYRKGEFAFTPGFNSIAQTGIYQGQQEERSSTKLNISHLGIVLTHAKRGKEYSRAGWKSASFAFGVNRVATFRNEYAYSGQNYKSSFVERFAEEFNRRGGLNNNTLGAVSYPAYAAWATYLIDRDYGGDSTQAKAYVPYTDGLLQRKTVQERGGMHEYVISGGGNYMDRLMLGATLGITRSTYDRTMQMSEEDLSANLKNDFRYVNYTERLNTEGTGFNLKLGAIFKPADAVRFGIAVHTPTKIYFNDSYSVEMESHTDSLKLIGNPGADPVTRYSQDTLQIFNYSMNTPYKAIASGTVMFGAYGFLTADAEYVDYRSMKYDYGIGYESESNAVNDVIRRTYTDAVNIRVGAEFRITDFAMRGGFAYYGSPYQTQPNAARTLISGGLGYRAPSWYFDASLVYDMQDRSEQPYVLSRVNADVPAATIQSRRAQVAFTLGRRL